MDAALWLDDDLLTQTGRHGSGGLKNDCTTKRR